MEITKRNKRVLRAINAAFKTMRGFSLIELIVVIAIFSTISLVVLANHSRFNSSVLLGSLAYKIALSVREAQVYGLSVQGQSSNFQVGYGVHFAGGTTFTFFADINGNKKYDAGTDTVVKTYTVSQGHTISDFCGIKSDTTRQCAASGVLTYLDVAFFRPDPDARMTSNVFASPNSYSSSEITVSSPAGSTRKVTIASTGQISVTVGVP